MKRINRNRFLFLGIVVVSIAAFAFWYKVTYSMEEASNYTIHTKEMPVKMAIATQGSNFKDGVVSALVKKYRNEEIFINVLDISSLHSLPVKEYDVVIILHTWEYGKPPKEVTTFIDEHIAGQNKFIVLATSGEGSNKIEGIDAIAGESIVENVGEYSDKISVRIDEIIYKKRD